MAGGWQEEEKLTEMEGCVYENEVILGAGPKERRVGMRVAVWG
jgi:hypothetical protein